MKKALAMGILFSALVTPALAIAGRILDRAGRNHQALLYRGREADVAIEHCRIIVQKPSGGRKLDEDDGIVQLALKIVASVILRLETFKFGDGGGPRRLRHDPLKIGLQKRLANDRETVPVIFTS
jgi:hypothetical protein